MIQRDPSQPHDSQAETLAVHRSEEAAQSMAVESPAGPLVDAIHTALAPESPEAVKARLWPTLREERGLWEGKAKKVLLDGNRVAVFIGTQPGFGDLPPFDMFNLTVPVGDYPEGSTVGVATLERMGYSAPRKPSK